MTKKTDLAQFDDDVEAAWRAFVFVMERRGWGNTVINLSKLKSRIRHSARPPNTDEIYQSTIDQFWVKVTDPVICDEPIAPRVKRTRKKPTLSEADEDFLKEIARCRKLLVKYEGQGEPGKPDAKQVREIVRLAEKAFDKQDKFGMLRISESLRLTK